MFSWNSPHEIFEIQFNKIIFFNLLHGWWNCNTCYIWQWIGGDFSWWKIPDIEGSFWKLRFNWVRVAIGILWTAIKKFMMTVNWIIILVCWFTLIWYLYSYHSLLKIEWKTTCVIICFCYVDNIFLIYVLNAHLKHHFVLNNS